MTAFNDQPIEEHIAQWRTYISRRQTLHGSDVEELEGHLRDELRALAEAGLTADEAFLVAVKRIGLQLLLVISAFVVDAVALWAIAARALSSASRPTESRLLARISFCWSTWCGLRGSMHASCFTAVRLPFWRDGRSSIYPCTPYGRPWWLSSSRLSSATVERLGCGFSECSAHSFTGSMSVGMSLRRSIAR